MAGSRPIGFWYGDSAELLAEFILSQLAFTTRVPRPNDVGHDFHCVHFRRSGRRLIAGPFFAVQVKSNDEPVVYEGKHQVEWVRNIENPFFLCVATRRTHTVELYSTWNRLNATLLDQADKIELIPGAPIAKRQVLRARNGTQRIPLGSPILSIGAEDIMCKDRVQNLSDILHDWVLLDRENIGNKHAHMYWTLGPISYEMNKPLPAASERDKWLLKFYWNNPNLNRSLINFARASTALRLVHNKCRHDKNPIWQRKIKALERALKAYREYVEKAEGLLQHTGLDVTMAAGR